MPLRVTILAAGLVSLALIGLGSLYAGALKREAAQTERNAALVTELQSLTEAHKRAQERVEYDRKVLVARQALKAAEARKLARENQTLLNALRAHETWSDTNVPPDVREALHGAAGALPEAPGGGSSTGRAGSVRD